MKYFVIFILVFAQAIISISGVSIKDFLDNNFEHDGFCKKASCPPPNRRNVKYKIPMVCAQIMFANENAEKETFFVSLDHPCELEYAQCFQGIKVEAVKHDNCNFNRDQLFIDKLSILFENDNFLPEAAKSVNPNIKNALTPLLRRRNKRNADATVKNGLLEVNASSLNSLQKGSKENPMAFPASKEKKKHIESEKSHDSASYLNVINYSEDSHQLHRHMKIKNNNKNNTVNNNHRASNKTVDNKNGTTNGRRLIGVNTQVGVNTNIETDNSVSIQIEMGPSGNSKPTPKPKPPPEYYPDDYYTAEYYTDEEKKRDKVKHKTTRRPRHRSRSREKGKDTGRHSRSRERDRYRSRENRGRYSRSRERYRSRERGRSRERDRGRYSRSRERDRGRYSRSRERDRGRYSRSRERDRGRYSRSRERDRGTHRLKANNLKKLGKNLCPLAT